MFSWNQLIVLLIAIIGIMTCDIIIIKAIKDLTTTLEYILTELEDYRRIK